MARPRVPDFSGWNWVPHTWSRSIAAAISPAVVAGGHRRRPDGGHEGVDEVHPGLLGAARSASATRRPGTARSGFHWIWGDLVPAGSRPTVPASTPSRRAPGASSDPSKSSCRPTQMPRNGTPVAMARRATSTRPLASSASAQRPNAPTPGSTTPSRPRPRPGSLHEPGRPRRGGRAPGAPTRGSRCRSRGRRSSPALVVHNVPLVEGTPPPSTRTASRSARATPLKVASTMWWVLRPSRSRDVQGDARPPSRRPARTPRPAGGRRAASPRPGGVRARTARRRRDRAGPTGRARPRRAPRRAG